MQPGQPYTAGAAGTFGRLTSTVGRTVGLGTPRQVQLARPLPVLTTADEQSKKRRASFRARPSFYGGRPRFVINSVANWGS